MMFLYCILVFLLKYNDFDAIFTGDISAEQEEELVGSGVLRNVELLKVGHHGSKYSTCEELLAATRPEVAIVSVAAGNSYGHPTQETLDRLEKYGCAVYRTDLDGTVIYKG